MDSVFKSLNNKTTLTIFNSSNVKTQKGNKDCGLFAVAMAT